MAKRIGNGVGAGDGWGGPAKGSAPAQKAAPFAPGNNAATTAGLTPRAAKAQIQAERTAALEDLLFGLATGAEREETRVSAATKLHAIYNGQPIARNINLNTDDIADLSDADIRAELERTGGAPIAPASGDASAGMPGRSSDVVH